MDDDDAIERRTVSRLIPTFRVSGMATPRVSGRNRTKNPASNANTENIAIGTYRWVMLPSTTM